MGCWSVAWIASALAAGQAGMVSTAGTAGAAPIALASEQTRPSAHEALVRIVEDFIRAQRTFDVPRLTALTTPDYLEISPVGEVDSREKMLSFYAPERKSSAPTIEIREPVVRVFRDSAIVVGKLAYTIQAPGQPPRLMELRASFVAHCVAGRWKLASAQYTAIRPAAK